MKKLSILLTGSGAPGWVPIYKCLVNNPDNRKFKIFGCDIQPITAGSYYAYKHFTVPSGTDKNFINNVLQICKTNQIDIIIPLTDSELIPFAKHQELFHKQKVLIPISSEQSLAVAMNKYLLYKFLKEKNLQPPDFIVVDNWKNFCIAIKKLGYPNQPVCFKPSVSWGSRGFRVLDSRFNGYQMLFHEKPNSTNISLTGLKSILDKSDIFPQLLVMEYLPGKEYSIDALSINKDIKYVIPRLRVKTKGGITTEGIVENNIDLIKLSEKIILYLNLQYSIGIQFKYDRENQPKVLEINPRLQGTTIMTQGAGINLPYFCIKALLKERIPVIKPNFDVMMIRHWQEVFIKKGVRLFNT